MIYKEESMLIQIMYRQGYSKKGIARELGISINTVRKYIRSGENPSYSSRAPKPMKLDPYRHYIKQRLDTAHPHWIPATVIYREIKAMGYPGRISMLRRYMRQLKPEVSDSSVVRFETNPGQQMQVDWAEFRKGQDRLSAFVATLGYSRASYVEFVTNEKLSTLLRCHENAFEYFGGVTHEILYDNMKTVIIERDSYGPGKHRLQSGFWDFSKHHGFIPRICRPYRAKTKGKVERFIHYLRYSFYRPLASQLKQQGLYLDSLYANQQVLSWLNQVANCRVHRTTNAVPFERLTQEQTKLQPIIPGYCHAATPMDKSLYRLNTINYSKQNVNLQHDLSQYDNYFIKGTIS